MRLSNTGSSAMRIVLVWMWLTVALAAQTPILWLKADALGLANNDPVSTWTDSSASSNDATGVTTQRPLFKTNVVNSLPAILCDGTDDVLQLESVIPSGAVTGCVVCKPAAEITVSSSESLLSGTAASKGALHLGNWTATTTGEVVSVLRQPDPGSAHIAYSGENLPAEWVIISFRINASGVDSKWSGFIKAQSTGGSGSQPNDTTRAWANVNLIGASSAAGDLPFSGHIAEIQIFDSYLTDAEYRSVISALATKYALTPPTLTAANVTQGAVQASVGWAIAGETVTIPAGTESWTSGISVSTGISVIGSTTVNAVAGTANDQTIILDNITSNGRAFTLSAPIGQTTRLSGITFNPGTRGSNNTEGIVSMGGAGEDSGKVVLDNCNLSNLEQDYAVKVYSAYGVINHNRLYDSGRQSIHLVGDALNGGVNIAGDATWADYPWFGTGKFMFIEDNYLKSTSLSETIHCIDGDIGGRWVVRYNQMHNTQVQTHGTENRYRGVRCTEVYENDFYFDHAWSGVGGLRTGPHLVHDNRLHGTRPDNWLSLSYLRYTTRFNDDVTEGFGGASGDNPWDINVTESDGVTHIDGNPSFLFASGTATTGSSETAMVAGGSPGWPLNQWVGYTVKQVSTGLINMIQSSTSDTLNVIASTQNPGVTPGWTNGDDFEIRRPLIAIDQPGRGKANLISGAGNLAPAPLIESGSSTQAWPDQALEPVYNYNNLYEGSELRRVLPAGELDPVGFFLQAGRDYYNDEDGASHAAVVAKYVAALNGVDYTGPYTYPHPLSVTEPSSSRKLLRLVQP